MLYKYCPKCGSLLEEIRKDGRSRLRCTSCKFIFYQNSKPTSSALIVDGDKVLLGRRNIEPAKGMWDVPGGFLELGEHPEQGMKREIREETGLEVEILDLLGIFMDSYDENTASTLNFAYVVKIKSGQMKAADDVAELKWFEVNNSPDDLAFKNGRDMLGCLKKWHKNKSQKED